MRDEFETDDLIFFGLLSGSGIVALCVVGILVYLLVRADPVKNYQLSDRKPVKCRASSGYCGVHLYDCEDFAEYWCQTNVKEVK